MTFYLDWKARLAEIEAEREFDKLHGPRKFVTRDLPAEKWYACKRCNGKGQYLESGDLHRSEGLVPCNCCYRGIVRTERVEIKRRIRVKAIGKVMV